ncbi:DnaJ domain-containing protein [Pelosinus sp. IPA-1]|uniref:DnaJ domain-containing protein n=1 Tax=Pelosinus sp. IPA-1 TaxID=3029569 RepID=UPI00243624D6|nr:DnaJ domain-containing protein [Pelosinus sp. IPA-1]GMA99916.1 hypothetical protein PIPA1_27160 [Pelosinus sp. IPA-1]
MKNYYDILAVRRESSQEEIKKSYRRLSKQYHPDLNPGNKDAESKFKEITEAYGTLGDQEAREQYDATLHTAGANESFQERGKPRPKQPNYSTETFNMGDVGRRFEHFFGYDPKTGERNQNFAGTSQGKKKSPLDTSHIFEGFFKPKKK